MPSVLEDPHAPTVHRTSGGPPFLTHLSPLPVEIVPRQVTLRDRVTKATLVPFSAPQQVPPSLLEYVCLLMNREVEAGDTYPMVEQMAPEQFAKYWFGNFAAVMIVGEQQIVDDLLRSQSELVDWEKRCLGSFYIKPNYPGRSSHVCNGGFLVGPAARNRGVGRLMGEGYLEWAPTLGYSYSVFNLVYETNVASCKIWDSLGFKRIGRVKGCGNLKSFPDQLIDAIQYGRELGSEGEEYQDEDRFDKIGYYLRNGKYPEGADRQEKGRLRSAATHYRLVVDDGSGQEKLMLKDKEVISERAKQDAIVRRVHKEAHAGINKTTATIAEQYHWNGIRSSVTVAIKDCPICQSRAGESSNGSHEKEQARQNAIELLGSETQHANPEPPSGYEAARDGRTQYDPSMTLDPRLTYNDNAG